MKVFKCVKFLVLVAMASVVVGFVVMSLWNWLMPGITGWHRIGYWQAVGLFLLSKILFGGFRGGHRGGRGGRSWKRRMEQKWSHMTPEERERFKQGMKARFACGAGGHDFGAEFGAGDMAGEKGRV